jgi:signal transduction histidine kinase
MRQVFRNILENAIGAASGPARIDVALRPCDRNGQRWLQCVITDHGVGMEPETLTRVFEPFYTTKQSGTGLGMAICKRIIDAHDGAVHATSAPGQGTSITIELPC